jgi:hypothetical protein
MENGEWRIPPPWFVSPRTPKIKEYFLFIKKQKKVRADTKHESWQWCLVKAESLTYPSTGQRPVLEITTTNYALKGQYQLNDIGGKI